MQVQIVSFSGPYRFLSNFAPSWVLAWSYSWPTVEHAYQASKISHLSPTDPLWSEFSLAGTPGRAKRLGRKVAMRSDWEDVKVSIMYELLRRKFADPSLRSALLATGDAILVEGNTWGDHFWGVCEGQGQNMLGNLLAAVRTQCRLETAGL